MKNAGVRPPVMSQSGLWKVFSVAQSCLPLCDHVCLFASPWTAARQAFPSITNFRSLLKLLSIESVMPSNHLIFCHALLLLPSIFPSMRVSFNESALHIRWPGYWSLMDWTPCSPRDSQESSPTPQFKSIDSSAQLSL